MTYQMKIKEKRVIEFLHVFLSPMIFVLVLILGLVQIHVYVMGPSNKIKSMPVEVRCFYSIFYSFTVIYFILKIILENQNG